MKYTKMLCWVDRQEQKSLNKAKINCYPIFFAKNKEEFVSHINSDVLPVISIKKVYHLNAVRRIVRVFSKIRFYAMTRLDGKFTTSNEFSFIVDEQNISNPDRSRSQYIASEFIALFVTIPAPADRKDK
jgi:hypothetical protein